TRIRDSTWGRECLGLTVGIAEDDDLLTWMETVDERVVGAWAGPSVRRGVVPDSSYMTGHRFGNLLFSFQRTDISVVATINDFNCIQADMSVLSRTGERIMRFSTRENSMALLSVGASRQLTKRC